MGVFQPLKSTCGIFIPIYLSSTDSTFLKPAAASVRAKSSAEKECGMLQQHPLVCYLRSYMQLKHQGKPSPPLPHRCLGSDER